MIQFFKRDQHKTSKVNHCLLVFLLGLLTIFPFTLYSQPKYGITTTTTVTPPYPITLDGFVADGGTKLSLQIMPTDINLSQYPVLMKLVISGNGVTIESKSLFVHEPVYLNGNELLTLSGSDLQMFFNPDNLSFNGYSKTQYQRNGRLPEGVYTIGFELYDVLRKVPVSSVKSSVVFMFLNEVPMLTLPTNNEMVSAAGTQTINFRWMTRHSPLSATFFNPEYQFEMWEIPEGRPAYEVVKGTRPFHMATTSSPYLTYGIAEPQLQPGKNYAWRVRESDPENRTLFKNEGYTEVYTFTYGYNCPAPELKAEKTGTSNFSVSWKADNNQKEFELRYRDKKKKNAVWYSQNTNLLSGKVENLKSNTVYEVEVCAICGDQRSEYSNRVEVNTKQNTSFKCGQVDSTRFPQNRNPLRKLSSGEVFKAYGFDVEVKEVTGGAGTFKGKGYVLVPLLNFIKIEASFDNVQINEDYELIGGEVKTIYNMNNPLVITPGEGVKGLSDLDDLKKMLLGNDEKNNFDSDSKNTRTVSVDSVKDIKIESNRIVITDVNGKIEEVPKGKIVVIKTSEGSDYVVDAANNAIYSSNNSGQAAKGGTPTGAITSAQEAGKGTPKYSVSFDKHKLSNYGFDFPTDKSPTGNYDQVEITGKPALVPWKALETGKIERLISKVTGGPADSIHYYQESNNMVMTSPGEDKSQHQIMINGLGSNDNDKLFAWYREFTGDTSKTYNRILAGQLNTVSYDKINVKVVLVPINGSSCPDPNEVKKQLNAIYSPAVVSWDVNTFNLTNVTFKGAVFDNTDNDKLMDYTADMKIARDALKEQAIYNRETYYLFFIDNAKETKSYMPLNKQFGFIVKGNLRIDDYTRTIAHELGHGPFRLRHTFSDENQYYQPEGTTDNLMDYAGADALKLNKYQWDWMHNPEWRIYAFEDEEEGEEFIYNYFYAQYSPTECKNYKGILAPEFKTYYAPSGLPFSLPNNACEETFSEKLVNNLKNESLFISKKALTSFKLDNKVYIAKANRYEFVGYVEYKIIPKFNEIPLIDKISPLHSGSLDIRIPGKIEYQRNFERLKDAKEYTAAGPLDFPEDISKEIICKKCMEPLLRHYCGKACLCKCYECEKRRSYLGTIGIPVFDRIGEKKEIKFIYYKPEIKAIGKGFSQEEIIHNIKAELNFKLSYMAKFPQETYENNAGNEAWDNIENLSSIMETYYHITENTKKKEIFSKFNKVFKYKGMVDKALKYALILENLNNKGYGELMSALILEIPYVSQAANFLVYTDSKEFHQASLDLFQTQIRELSKYKNTQSEISKLLECIDNAKRKISYIEEGERYDYHSSHCTCF